MESNAKIGRVDGVTQGWASFSCKEPDLEKLLKPRAACRLENKVKTSWFFWRFWSTYEYDLQDERFSLLFSRFLLQFCSVEAYFLKITAIHDL